MTKHQPFDPRLPSLIAAGLGTPKDLAAQLGISASEFERIEVMPSFQQALASATKELEEHGFTPEVAELQLLQEAHPTMLRDVLAHFHNQRCTIEQKLKILEATERMLDRRRQRLSPKGGDDSGPKFAINITLPGVGDIKLESIGGDPEDLFAEYEEVDG